MVPEIVIVPNNTDAADEFKKTRVTDSSWFFRIYKNLTFLRMNPKDTMQFKTHLFLKSTNSFSITY